MCQHEARDKLASVICFADLTQINDGTHVSMFRDVFLTTEKGNVWLKCIC